MPYAIILLLLHRPKVDYFCHPMGIWRSLKSVIGFKEYTDDDQAYKVVQSDRDPNREVFIYIYVLFKMNELNCSMN